MIVIDCEQYSDEWWAARCGVPTASAFGKLITPGGKPSTQAKSYMYELIAERFAPDENQIEPTEWMLRGRELEAEARNWYAMKRGEEVAQVGFILNDDRTFGGSPDGMLDDNVPLEIKCPKGSTHVGYLLNKKLPVTYAPQVHGQMLVTGASRAVFISYHPAFAPLVIEVKRDDYTATLSKAIDKFVHDLGAARKRLPT